VDARESPRTDTAPVALSYAFEAHVTSWKVKVDAPAVPAGSIPSRKDETEEPIVPMKLLPKKRENCLILPPVTLLLLGDTAQPSLYPVLLLTRQRE
jgi:hypothetical protein